MTAAELVGSDLPERNEVRSATGLLRDWNRAGVLEPADVHVATRLGVLGGEADQTVLLAAALVVRAARTGSTCVDLAEVTAGPDLELPVPPIEVWIAAVAGSPLTGEGLPLRWDADRLYLDRYWQEETQIGADLLDRDRRPPPEVDVARMDAALHRLFEADAEGQAAAARAAVLRWTTVLAGGPGTGKTTTVARVLAVLADQPGAPPRIALAAPTGKAAARLTEAVRAETAELAPADRARLGGLTASTLHRLLGSLPRVRNRFRHNRDNRLPHDVVVVDEASMVSLTMMARLLEALRPDARLVLVGDPDQLASVEAGAVLADLAAGLTALPDPAAALPDPQDRSRHGVVRLDRVWRFGGAIADLAAAVRAGADDDVLAVLTGGDPGVGFGADGLREDVVGSAVAIRAAAEAGDAAEALHRMEQHRLVCGHRAGPDGVAGWTRLITGWLAEDAGLVAEGEWYVGRPLLVTANDYTVGLFNGDTGVVVRAQDGAIRAAFRRGDALVSFAPSRLAELLTVHAMTVHRSQGSQFDRVSVSLPAVDSPLLTRELFYTGLTRARRFVRVIGSEEQVRAAVIRPAARATGLRDRLASG